MVVLGLVLGGAATAFAALLVGDDGYVFGWSVVKDNAVLIERQARLRALCDQPSA